MKTVTYMSRKIMNVNTGKEELVHSITESGFKEWEFKQLKIWERNNSYFIGL